MDNKYIRGSLKVATVLEKLRSEMKVWYGHLMRKDESHVTRRSLVMSRGTPVARLRKIWMYCMKGDMIKGVTTEMSENRLSWRTKI